MKTDKDASYAGIDSRKNVLESMKELLKAFEELGERATEQVSTVRSACIILGNVQDSPRLRIDETRARLILMRDGLLSANQFEWSVLCTHAVWWLSVILEG